MNFVVRNASSVRSFVGYADYDTAKITCPHCGSDSVSRLISHVRVAHNSNAHLAELADPGQFGPMENDPRALGRAMKEMQGGGRRRNGGEFNEVGRPPGERPIP